MSNCQIYYKTHLKDSFVSEIGITLWFFGGVGEKVGQKSCTFFNLFYFFICPFKKRTKNALIFLEILVFIIHPGCQSHSSPQKTNGLSYISIWWSRCLILGFSSQIIYINWGEATILAGEYKYEGYKIILIVVARGVRKYVFNILVHMDFHEKSTKKQWFPLF